MMELTSGVSWTGVIVGAIAAFVVGWAWFSPMLFGKKWADAHGVEMGSASEMPVKAMVAQLIGLFLVSWFVGVTAVGGALATAILALLGFAMLYDSGAMFAKVPTPGRLINLGYWIVSFAVMVIAQGIF
jgi:hypothetical protein